MTIADPLPNPPPTRGREDSGDPSPSPDSGEGRGGGAAAPTPVQPVRRTRNRARALRGRMTEAEKLLWLHLRKRRLGNYRFRRQAPVGRYVADFVCLSARLVVEVDGSGHMRRTAADQARDDWFAANGYRVMRFWNNEVLGNVEGVLTAILSALEGGADPLPNPPPTRGREDSGAPSPSPGTGEGRGGGAGTDRAAAPTPVQPVRRTRNRARAEMHHHG